MIMKSRHFKFTKTFNVFRVVKVAFAIALIYLLTPILFDNFFPSLNFQKTDGSNDIVDKYYEKRKNWLTSNLGTMLFKNKPIQANQDNRVFSVLIWKYWGWLKKRHLEGHAENDPLDECSVKNCMFTGDDTSINEVNAVLVHIQHGIFPNVTKRNPWQIWVFLSDESPFHTFSMAKRKPSFSNLANIFNWSMTYRSDADVPVPYGRTVPLPMPSTRSLSGLIPHWKDKKINVLVNALISNCAVRKRMDYIRELQRHIKVDVYGKCSDDNQESCPGSFKTDCPVINNYYFYLAFENSECRQYFTEKIFYNAYAKGAIPIVMGPPVSDCEKILPPQSFLHVDNFDSPEHLATEILRISESEEKIQMYHKWRRHFEIVNEHGYFGTKSMHLCRLCEALNLNDGQTKVYDEDSLKLYLDPKLLCSNIIHL
ncbi:hypothetical protein ABMA27_014727 [Loxostege sticticalis]|uniref:Fucosyltransferase n=1 Tax=Loxostege sticticalis TaxID=481309 RepID=A0ABR3I9Z0_LOXSC